MNIYICMYIYEYINTHTHFIWMYAYAFYTNICISMHFIWIYIHRWACCFACTHLRFDLCPCVHVVYLMSITCTIIAFSTCIIPIPIIQCMYAFIIYYWTVWPYESDFLRANTARTQPWHWVHMYCVFLLTHIVYF